MSKVTRALSQAMLGNSTAGGDRHVTCFVTSIGDYGVVISEVKFITHHLYCRAREVEQETAEPTGPGEIFESH